MKTFKRILASLMVAVMVLTAAPLNGFVGLELPELLDFSILSSAAGATEEELGFAMNNYIAGIILNTNLESCAVSDSGKSIASMHLDYYTQLNNVSLSKSFTDALESDTGFMSSVAAWETLTFSPKDIYEESINEIGYYQAILFEILDVAVDYNFVPSIISNSNKHVVSTLKSINELEIKVGEITVDGNTSWSLLDADKQHRIIQATAGRMTELDMRNQSLADFSMIVKACTTVTDFVEKAAQLTALVTLTEDVKTIIGEMYSNCSYINNPKLKTAILEIKTAMESKMESVGTIGLELLASAGKYSMDTFLDIMWGECVSVVLGYLGAGFLIGQVIGRGISNILFATDETIEQFYTMQALEDIETLLCFSVKKLGSKFCSSQSTEDANTFLRSVDLLYNTYKTDFEYAIKFSKIINEKGLWNKVKLFCTGGSDNVEEVKRIANSMNSSMASTLGMLTDIDSYCFYLEYDKPEVFEAYYGGLTDEEMTNRYVEKVRLLTVACPTDVEIYNWQGDLVVSVENNELFLCQPGYYCVIEDDIKYVLTSVEQQMSMKIIGTDEGKMTYTVCEADGEGFKRTMSFDNVKLTDGCEFSTALPKEILVDSKKYNLNTENGNEITCSYDSENENIGGFPPNLLQKVLEAIKYSNNVVDISVFEIPMDKAKDLITMIATKLEIAGYSHSFSYDVIYDSHKNTIAKLNFSFENATESMEPTNLIDAEEYVLTKIKKNTESMNDFDKVIYIHDYLVLNGEYDLELMNIIDTNGTLSDELISNRYDKYALLVNGTGICDTYTQAYKYLLENCGIDCITVSSSDMNHAWNLVEIDNEWYHVDCTWDDPVNDRVGITRYDYFLLNDEEISSKEHYSWKPTTISATSNAFSSIPRGDSDKIAYGEGKWCYYLGEVLYCSDIYGKNPIEISDVQFSAMDIYNGNIYGVKDNVLYRINIEKPEEGYEVVCPFSQSVKSIYIDTHGVLEYYTKAGKSFETINLNKSYEVEGIYLENNTIIIKNGDSIQIQPKAIVNGSPINAFDGSFVWESFDDAIVTVDSAGVLTPNLSGKTTIKISLGKFSVECTVIVEKWEHMICGTLAVGTSWMFDENQSLLYIKGEGLIPDFASEIETPWYKYRNHIKNINISDKITSIGSYSFSHLSNIKELNIPKSIVAINEYALSGCNSLEELSIPFVGLSRTANNTYDAVFGHIFGRSETGVGQYHRLEDGNLYYYTYAIPESLRTVSITDASIIPFGAFHNCSNINKIDINDGVEQIGAYSFASCTGLTDFIVPDTVEYIAEDSFNGCSSLVSITLPFVGSSRTANNTYDSVFGYIFGRCDSSTGIIQYYMSDGSSLSYYYYDVPQSIKTVKITDADYIPFGAFHNCSNVIDFAVNDISVIYGYAFANCSAVKEIEIPDSVLTIYEKAFNGCNSLEKISLPFIGSSREASGTYDAVLGYIFGRANSGTLQYGVVSGTSISGYYYAIPATLKSVTVTDAKKIAVGAFCNCSNLSFLRINDGVTQLSDYSLMGCSGLEELRLPSTFKTLSSDILTDCSNLKKLYMYSRSCTISNSSSCIPRNATIYAYSNSTANKYADQYNRNFVPIDVAISAMTDSGLVVDSVKKIIYGIESGSEDIISKLVVTGEGSAIASTVGTISTGITVTLKDIASIITDVYTVIIFGDVNGDSWYDGQDAIIVDCLANGMLTKEDVSEAVYMAADCNHDGVIDQLDVGLLNQAGALLANVDQSKSAEELLETSSAYVEYLDLIDQSPEIEVEDDEATENEATEDESDDSTPVVENSIFAFISEFIAMLQKLFDFILSFVNV